MQIQPTMGGLQKEEKGHCSFIDRPPPPCQRVGDDDILVINKAPCDADIAASLKGDDQKKKKEEAEQRRR